MGLKVGGGIVFLSIQQKTPHFIGLELERMDYGKVNKQ
jgi:hypothetical protein